MTEYVGAIKKQTLENTYFRQVLFTAQHSQLVRPCSRGNSPQRREIIENGIAKALYDLCSAEPSGWDSA